MSFGQALRAAREARGLPQFQACIELGGTTAAISGGSAGRGEPRVGVLARIVTSWPEVLGMMLGEDLAKRR